MTPEDRAILPLILLILVDTFATIHWYGAYGIEEVNPLMAFFLDRDVIYFFMVKMGISLPGIVILHKFYNRLLSKVGLFVLYLAYTSVLLIHLGIFVSLTL